MSKERTIILDKERINWKMQRMAYEIWEHFSFYEQEQQAEAAALPPHILTDEEVRQLHAEADRKLEEKKKQPQQPYNTFGKMYFPPEGRNPAK